MTEPYRILGEQESIVIEKLPMPWRQVLVFLVIGLIGGGMIGSILTLRIAKTRTITETVEVKPSYHEGDPCFDEIVKVSSGGGKCSHPNQTMKWDSELGSIHCICYPHP